MNKRSLIHNRKSSKATAWFRKVEWVFSPFYPRTKKDWLFLNYWVTVTLVMVVQNSALAQQTPANPKTPANPTPTGTTGCGGWMCGPRAAILQNPAFSENRASLLVNFIFVALNAAIIVAIGFQAYKIFTAMREEEGWQTMGRSLVGEVLMLIATNYLGGWITGTNA